MTSNHTCLNVGTGAEGAADNEATGEELAGALGRATELRGGADGGCPCSWTIRELRIMANTATARTPSVAERIRSWRERVSRSPRGRARERLEPQARRALQAGNHGPQCARRRDGRRRGSTRPRALARARCRRPGRAPWTRPARDDGPRLSHPFPQTEPQPARTRGDVSPSRSCRPCDRSSTFRRCSGCPSFPVVTPAPWRYERAIHRASGTCALPAARTRTWVLTCASWCSMWPSSCLHQVEVRQIADPSGRTNALCLSIRRLER